MITGRGVAAAVATAAFLCALAGCGGSPAAPPAPSTSSADSGDEAGDQEAVSAAHCGVERWSVKTGTDADVGLINLTAPATPTTIGALTALAAPNPIPLHNRVRPTETTVWQIRAILTGYKQEADSDYHLVLSDAGKTMIAEIPSPSCVQPDVLKAGIAAARKVFDGKYRAGPAFRHVHQLVTITGVGFFDFLHGQAGVAPNGIELHPVLSVSFGGGQ